METTGRLVSAVMDFMGGKLAVTFEVDASCAEECRRMAGVEQLDIKATKHRERRSLDANAYFHVLAGKIADSLGLSKARAKNMLICRYGQPELLPDGTPLVYKTNALQACGVIDNDGWAQVENFTHEFYVDSKNPRIEIDIEEVGGQSAWAATSR